MSKWGYENVTIWWIRNIQPWIEVDVFWEKKSLINKLLFLTKSCMPQLLATRNSYEQNVILLFKVKNV